MARHRLSSGAERHDASLATSITSSVIEKCDSPDDTSSIEGSTTHSVIEAESSSATADDDLQCVLKDMDEYEFVVGVAEDRNKRCRRTMEVSLLDSLVSRLIGSSCLYKRLCDVFFILAFWTISRNNKIECKEGRCQWVSGCRGGWRQRQRQKAKNSNKDIRDTQRGIPQG